MGSYIDITEDVRNLALQGSNENKREFSNELKSKYLSAFIQLRSNLEQSYKNKPLPMDINQRESIAEKMRDNMIKTYRSSRGLADILTEEKLQEYIKKEKDLQDKLKSIRNSMYEVQDNSLYIKFATQMMALVYALKRDISQEKEEQFSFIYKGDNSGTAVSFKIPVTEFLLKEEFLNSISLQYGAISSWTGAIDQSLRFNNSIGSQLEQLSQDKNSGIKKDIISDTFQYERKRFIKEKRIYKTKRGAETRLDELTNILQAINIKIYRMDKNYWVVESGAFQRGFVDQGLFAYYEGDLNATFSGDTYDWYKKADVTGKDGQGYSVKSLLGGNPSLVSLKSLYTVSSQIISILQSSNQENPSSIAEQIKTQVFEIDSALDKDIDKVFNYLE